MTRDEIKQRMTVLSATEVMTASNSGTFGATECCQCVGTGESRYGERRVY